MTRDEAALIRVLYRAMAAALETPYVSLAPDTNRSPQMGDLP